MKYANAALWIFYGWLLRKLRFPKRVVHEAEDQASMRMFDCSLDFQPTGKTAPPYGWTCPHITITTGGLISGRPMVGCGCVMEPIVQTTGVSA
jgi:hypothetical protein